ncbi:unnamed protein product [Rotaria sordida]|uniref:Uncharacterized protein n=1 Tax=Rotaria sordida TaxID=392033 RepID=A0A818RUC9_9BILA|nr:unnamed protein product [Rotaria sordida]CAF1112026.1 unnamed protein product [Rotaria sordida]CAF3641546.1 unnamed protein product [Rotaria sordida]CAF3655943.1 unnamed protein product [Rotaria sordida]
MESVSLTNQKPQKEKEYEERNLSIAQFFHLTELNFDDTDDDYIKQFLVGRRIYLSNNVLISVEYYRLQRVTHNFTRASTKKAVKNMDKYYNDELDV